MPARNGKREFLLSAIAFALGAVPIFMLLLGGMAAMGSMGMSVSDMINNPPDKAMMTPMVQAIHNFMQGYIPYVLFPATVALLFVWTYASRNYPRLANRIGAGLAAGFIASLGLDTIRVIGVKMGAFPGDMPTMMGQMITGEMGTSAGVLLAGYTYHLLFNG